MGGSEYTANGEVKACSRQAANPKRRGLAVIHPRTPASPHSPTRGTMTKYNTAMTNFVAPEPTIEAPGAATTPQADAAVYMVVLTTMIALGLVAGVVLAFTSPWASWAITTCVTGMLFVLAVLVSIILSGSLPAVLHYLSTNAHDKRAYNIEMEKLSIESERISVPQLMDPARADAVQWLRTMYTNVGPNFNEVRPGSGQLIHVAPWSNRSDNQHDGVLMLDVLKQAGIVNMDGQNPAINIQRFPTLDAALRQLR